MAIIYCDKCNGEFSDFVESCPFCNSPRSNSPRLAKQQPQVHVARNIPNSGHICGNCGFVGESKSITKGSILIEAVLWLCFIIPGIIYSLWRLSSRYQACPKCQAPNMIPLNSPRGKKLFQEFGQ